MPGNERGGWMQTVTGKCFYPLFPNRDDIEIQDIAFGLAGEFRFGNQCHQRYTVAQHCVHVAEIVPAHEQLHAQARLEAVQPPAHHGRRHAFGLGPLRDGCRLEAALQMQMHFRLGKGFPAAEFRGVK